MNAAAVVHPTLVLVNARRHVLDPVALVAEEIGSTAQGEAPCGAVATVVAAVLAAAVAAVPVPAVAAFPVAAAVVQPIAVSASPLAGAALGLSPLVQH